MKPVGRDQFTYAVIAGGVLIVLVVAAMAGRRLGKLDDRFEALEQRIEALEHPPEPVRDLELPKQGKVR